MFEGLFLLYILLINLSLIKLATMPPDTLLEVLAISNIGSIARISARSAK